MPPLIVNLICFYTEDFFPSDNTTAFASVYTSTRKDKKKVLLLFCNAWFAYSVIFAGVSKNKRYPQRSFFFLKPFIVSMCQFHDLRRGCRVLVDGLLLSLVL